MIAIDFETFYDKDTFSVASLGPEAYANDPRFEAYLLSAYDRSRGISFVGAPKDFDWRLLDGQPVVSHNAEFEWQICRHLTQSGVIPSGIQPSDWIDSADIAAFNGAPRKLALASKELLGRPMSKELRDRMSGVTWTEAKIKGWGDEMLQYGLTDAVNCHDIAEKFFSTWPAREQWLSKYTRRSGRKGCRINTDYLSYGLEYMARSKLRAEEDIPWDWDRSEKTPLSSKAFALECRKANIPVPASLAEEDPRFLEWDAVYGGRYPWAYALRVWRKANTREKKLRTIQRRLRADGTVPTYLQYYGAHTGRWSGVGGINWQNLDSETFVSYDSEEFSKGFTFRSLLIPRPGNKFFIADLSQIEPRCLNWLAGNRKFLQECRTMSPYVAYARLCLGWTGGPELKTANKELYKAAKAVVLGAGYGCGGEKFASTAYKLAGLTLDVATATRYIAEFRKNNPLITGFWDRLKRGMFAASAGDHRYEIELPSGRSQNYYDVVCLGRELKARTELGGPMLKFYGGKLCENVCQAVARDVFVEGLEGLDKAGFHVPFTVHDEYIIDAPAGTDVNELRDFIARTPDWLPGTPIECEINTADHYIK